MTIPFLRSSSRTHPSRISSRWISQTMKNNTSNFMTRLLSSLLILSSSIRQKSHRLNLRDFRMIMKVCRNLNKNRRWLMNFSPEINNKFTISRNTHTITCSKKNSCWS